MSWLELIPRLIPLVVSSGESLWHLIEAIRKSRHGSDTEKDEAIKALIKKVVDGIAEVNAAPGPYDPK